MCCCELKDSMQNKTVIQQEEDNRYARDCSIECNKVLVRCTIGDKKMPL
uniref:Uncharacterized protein n=1 Tax=Arundo donax TaxID=35708 RepID=A0A0A9BRV8_ARUDO